jgi:hypothetical protein
LHNEINIPDIQYYSNSLPVGKGRLKERCGLEARTNFFSFRKVEKTRCGLDSRIYGITATGNRTPGVQLVAMPTDLYRLRI